MYSKQVKTFQNKTCTEPTLTLRSAPLPKAKGLNPSGSEYKGLKGVEEEDDYHQDGHTTTLPTGTREE